MAASLSIPEWAAEWLSLICVVLAFDTNSSDTEWLLAAFDYSQCIVKEEGKGCPSTVCTDHTVSEVILASGGSIFGSPL